MGGPGSGKRAGPKPRSKLRKLANGRWFDPETNKIVRDPEKGPLTPEEEAQVEKDLALGKRTDQRSRYVPAQEKAFRAIRIRVLNEMRRRCDEKEIKKMKGEDLIRYLRMSREMLKDIVQERLEVEGDGGPPKIEFEMKYDLSKKVN